MYTSQQTVELIAADASYMPVVSSRNLARLASESERGPEGFLLAEDTSQLADAYEETRVALSEQWRHIYVARFGGSERIRLNALGKRAGENTSADDLTAFRLRFAAGREDALGTVFDFARTQEGIGWRALRGCMKMGVEYHPETNEAFPKPVCYEEELDVQPIYALMALRTTSRLIARGVPNQALHPPHVEDALTDLVRSRLLRGQE